MEYKFIFHKTLNLNYWFLCFANEIVEKQTDQNHEKCDDNKTQKAKVK